ncbi:MAG: LamG domain-containing protein, partial [Verrucomicrobiota bacterium]
MAVLFFGLCVTPKASAGVLAHWRFDEVSGGTAGDQTGVYNGNLSPSGAAFVAGGVSGNAIRLTKSSNGFIDIGNRLPLTNRSFSISGWVKMLTGDRTPSSILLSKQNAGTENGFMLSVNNSGVLYGRDDKVMFYDSSSPGEEVISSTTVNDGQWHHVVAVYVIGAQKRIYVDGAPSEAFNASQPIVDNSASLLIGGIAYSGVRTGQFTGFIDDLQIYDYPIDDAEVTFLRSNPGIELPPPSLLAHWRFDDEEGNVATEYVTGRNATLSPMGASFVTEAVSGKALSLNRTLGGFANVGNELQLTNSSYTVVAWIKMNAGDQTSNSMILAKQSPGTE